MCLHSWKGSSLSHESLMNWTRATMNFNWLSINFIRRIIKKIDKNFLRVFLRLIKSSSFQLHRREREKIFYDHRLKFMNEFECRVNEIVCTSNICNRFESERVKRYVAPFFYIERKPRVCIWGFFRSQAMKVRNLTFLILKISWTLFLRQLLL